MEPPKNRNIIYDKKTGRPAGYSSKENALRKEDTLPPPPPKPKVKEIDRSKRIIEWLDTHSLLNVAGLCKLIGYDRSNFTKAREAGKLPEAVIEPVEIILNHYGYGK